jgi:hypothetical protein
MSSISGILGTVAGIKTGGDEVEVTKLRRLPFDTQEPHHPLSQSGDHNSAFWLPDVPVPHRQMTLALPRLLPPAPLI